MDPGLNKKLDMLIKGYKKKCGDWKQSGEMAALDGKQPLSHAGLRMLAFEFLTMKPESSKSGNHRTSAKGAAPTWLMGPFAWLFLLLQWNLISRSISVAMIMLSHIAWKVWILFFNAQYF